MITKRLPHVRPNRQPGTLSRRSQPEVRLPYQAASGRGRFSEGDPDLVGILGCIVHISKG